MLGHASTKMTLDTYGSLFEEDLEELADRPDDRIREADVTHTKVQRRRSDAFPQVEAI